MSHTSEPWTVSDIGTDEYGYEFAEINGQDTSQEAVICELFGINNDPGANGKRIVACVNALAGIKDPATAIPAMIEALERLYEGPKQTHTCSGAANGCVHCIAREGLALAKELK